MGITDIDISDISGDDFSVLKNQRKKVKKAIHEPSDEEVDELPEDSDDDLPPSSISGLGEKMRNSMLLDAPSILEEAPPMLEGKKNSKKERKKEKEETSNPND